MSSHHVVREAQEPALLVLQAKLLKHSAIAPLLEWSPTILVAAEILDEVLEHQIKIDGIIHGKDQNEAFYQRVEENAPLFLIARKEEESLFSAALSFLHEHGHSAVNVLVQAASPAYENLKRQLIEEKISLNVVLLTEKTKLTLCRSGKYFKWFPAGEKVQLQTGMEEVTLSTTGFSTNLDQAPLPTITEMTTAGDAIISIEGNGPFWVLEKLY